MNDIAEGLGTGIEGALLGGAIERRHGNITVKHADVAGPDASGQTACANCGALTSGDYCSNCGQKTHIHRTLSAIGHDLVHGILHLDGKLWRTLPLLAFKPGHLPRRYIDGERASFVSPMAMFLFSVFAMFAVFQIIGIGLPTDLGAGASGTAASEIGAEREALKEQKSSLQTALENADDPDAQAAIAGEMEAVDAELGVLAVAERIVAPGDEGSDEPAVVAQSETTIDLLSEGTSAELKAGGELDLPFVEALVKKWRDNPGLMFYKLQANGYKFSWLLIPLSIPFVWLLFAWKRRFEAYDHAVFVTYSLAFMSLLFIAVSLLSLVEATVWMAGLLVAFVPPIHVYKQLRGTYGLDRFSALWRLLALSIFIWIVLALFLQTLLLLGAF
ncbi:MAG: DUF3667 domain-containing protein [Erythrobacter sp.]|jgi:hypothetical protein|nr:DUF3667 domain-containing protein [Erythrobacter sp.]